MQPFAMIFWLKVAFFYGLLFEIGLLLWLLTESEILFESGLLVWTSVLVFPLKVAFFYDLLIESGLLDPTGMCFVMYVIMFLSVK